MPKILPSNTRKNRNESQAPEMSQHPPRSNSQSSQNRRYPQLSKSRAAARARSAGNARRRNSTIRIVSSVLADAIPNADELRQSVNRVMTEHNARKVVPALEQYKKKINAFSIRNANNNGSVVVEPGVFKQTQKTQNAQIKNLMKMKKILEVELGVCQEEKKTRAHENQEQKKTRAREKMMQQFHREQAILSERVLQTRTLEFEQAYEDFFIYVEYLKKQVVLESKAILKLLSEDEVNSARDTAIKGVSTLLREQWKNDISDIRKGLAAAIQKYFSSAEYL